MKRFVVLLGVVALGCSAPPPDGRHAFALPSRTDFPPVSQVLESHCGSLDCHGSASRNLRVYGINGLRLEGVTGTDPTTEAEHEATFQSIAFLEPEKLGQVVVEGGRQPERLSLVRKARGTEKHKGGGLLPEGSDGDRCIVSWLAGTLDVTACDNAAEFTRPDTP